MNDYLFIRLRTPLRLTGTGGASARTMTATSVITIPIVRTVKNVSIAPTPKFQSA
jgi:hypothetical protein